MGEGTRNILLVEDEAVLAMATVRQLRERGYSVEHAFDGESALARATADPGSIDLILMDINLGEGMSGPEAAREILESREIPIVFLSSHTEKSIVESTEEISSYGYVSKNSGITMLDASIKMAFRLFEARKSIHAKNMAFEATNEELRVTIEELTAVNQRLAISEDKFIKAFRMNPDSLIISRISDGAVIDANEGAMAATGYTKEEAINRSTIPGDLGLWARTEDRDRMTRELREYGKVIGFEAEFRRKDGRKFIGLMSARVIEIEGEKCLLSITRDITERKQAEEKVAKLNRTRAVVSEAMQLIVRETDVRSILEGACRIAVEKGKFYMAWIGLVDEVDHVIRPFASAGAVDGYLDGISIPVPDSPMGRGPTGRAVREDQISVCADIRTDERVSPWRDRALARGYRSSAGFPLHTGSKVVGVFSVFSDEPGFFSEEEVSLLAQLALDISFALDSLKKEELRGESEKKLRESEARFRTVFELAPVGMSMTGPDGRLVEVNKAFCEMLGRSASELVSLPYGTITHPDDIGRSDECVQACLSGKVAGARLVKRYIHREGHPIWADVSIALLRDERGEPAIFITHMLDITENKRFEDRLQRLVAEKDTLMKELQHRVKNNLGVVASLLNLEEGKCLDESARNALSNAIARVSSISAIYERLYLSEDLASVDLALYVEDLVLSIFASYNLDPKRIALRIRTDRILLDSKRSVPLGLILNEVISNALKYAYPSDKSGEVRVELRRREGAISLEVSDDGSGIPDEFLAPGSPSMGMTLVRMLAQQIGAAISIDNKYGTRVRLSFEG
jgi:PAS domain S-box-containing protein